MLTILSKALIIIVSKFYGGFIWTQIIFALPILDGILFGIYRICKGNLPNIVLGIIWIFVGAAIFWILDIVFLLLKGKVLEL